MHRFCITYDISLYQSSCLNNNLNAKYRLKNTIALSIIITVEWNESLRNCKNMSILKPQMHVLKP